MTASATAAMVVSWWLQQISGPSPASRMEMITKPRKRTRLKATWTLWTSTSNDICVLNVSLLSEGNVFYYLSVSDCHGRAEQGFVISNHQLITPFWPGEVGHAVSLVTPGWRRGGSSARRQLCFHTQQRHSTSSFSPFLSQIHSQFNPPCTTLKSLLLLNIFHVFEAGWRSVLTSEDTRGNCSTRSLN